MVGGPLSLESRARCGLQAEAGYHAEPSSGGSNPSTKFLGADARYQDLCLELWAEPLVFVYLGLR